MFERCLLDIYKQDELCSIIGRGVHNQLLSLSHGQCSDISNAAFSTVYTGPCVICFFNYQIQTFQIVLDACLPEHICSERMDE